MRSFTLLAALLLLAPATRAEVDLSPLPSRPSTTLPAALERAKKEEKAVFLVLYDDTLTHARALEFYLDGSGIKAKFEENFVAVVRDRRRPDVKKYDDPGHEWGRGRYVVLTPAGQEIASGRIIRNDEAGRDNIIAAIAAWDRYKPIPLPKNPGPTPGPQRPQGGTFRGFGAPR